MKKVLTLVMGVLLLMGCDGNTEDSKDSGYHMKLVDLVDQEGNKHQVELVRTGNIITTVGSFHPDNCKYCSARKELNKHRFMNPDQYHQNEDSEE